MTDPDTESNCRVSADSSAEGSPEREATHRRLPIRQLTARQPDTSVALRDLGARAKDGLRAWIVPPRPLSEPPPTWTELSAYAYRGSWTRDTRGFIRGLGTIWLVLVSFLVIAPMRIFEWAITRPSRAWVLLGGSIVFLKFTGPGAWVAHHIVHPVLSALGWIFT